GSSTVRIGALRAPVAQPAEAGGLNPLKYGFESHRGHPTSGRDGADAAVAATGPAPRRRRRRPRLRPTGQFGRPRRGPRDLIMVGPIMVGRVRVGQVRVGRVMIGRPATPGAGSRTPRCPPSGCGPGSTS